MRFKWNEFKFGLIRIENLVSYLFKFIRIHSYRLTRNVSETDSGMTRNSSDWLGMHFNLILPPGQKDKGTPFATKFRKEFYPSESEPFRNRNTFWTSFDANRLKINTV